MRAASAGRMGSGTEWLHDLIGQIEQVDEAGPGELPTSVSQEMLAVQRINMPEQIARWVFDIVCRYHAPSQDARLQGFARILMIVPATEYRARLVLATPRKCPRPTRTDGAMSYGRDMAKAARILAALKRDGWIETRRSGSHRVLSKGDHQRIWAYHDGVDLGGPALARISRDYGYTADELRRL